MAGFRMAARVLRQLGAELITSDDIALNELIKNAFDAGSPEVEIIIKSPFIESKIRKLTVDNIKEEIKCCFDNESVKDKSKTEIINKINSEKFNTLDDIARIISSFNEIHIIDTGNGMDKDKLENAFLVVGTPNKWLVKQESNDKDVILGDKGVGRLSMMRLGQYSKIKSTQKNDAVWNQIEFDWNEFDDPYKYVEDIEIKIDSSEHKENRSLSGTCIFIKNLNKFWSLKDAKNFSNNYLRRLQNPFSIEKLPFPIVIKFNDIEIDIPSLYKWFKELANFEAKIDFTPNVKDENDIVLKRTLKWHGKESDEIRYWTLKEISNNLSCTRQDLNKLGPFIAHCLWFNRGKLGVKGIDIDQDLFKKELNLWCGGFSIYRDGFRVGTTGSLEDDWMEMDTAALKSKGYTLNRYQTIGSLQITSTDNKSLIDSSNREKIISCDSQILLKQIMSQIIAIDLRSHINTVKDIENKIKIAEETTESSLQESTENLKKTLNDMRTLKRKLPKDCQQEFTGIEDSLKSHLEDVRKLKNVISEMSEKDIEIIELAGIGLVVEKVIHELNRLTTGTQDYLQKLEGLGVSDEVTKVINILKQQMMVTNKRIRTVDVLSPSGRQRKGVFNIKGLIESVIESNASKLERHGVKVSILLDGEKTSKAFNVNMVQGLVAQILENLINNSVYWLSQGLLEGEDTPRIIIDIDTKTKSISFSDNGPGIEPRYKNEVLKPYFTTRPKGKGLGLYIAQELAEYHKTKFYLDNTPNAVDGRLRSFILELPTGA